jgi:hypothetical protein
MTARKRTPATKGKPWTCPECEATGQAENAEAAALAWIRHWNATHQDPGF